MHQNQISQVFPEETIKYGGKQYALRPPTWETRRLYSAYLEDGANQSAVNLQRLRSIPQAIIVKTLAELAVASGSEHAFDWGSEVFRKSLGATENMKHLVILTFAQKDSDGKVTNGEFLDPEDAHQLIDAMWEAPVDPPYQIQFRGEEWWVRTLGDKITATMWEYIDRPNSPAPAEDKNLAS